MTEVELKPLSDKIQTLLQSHRRLSAENKLLRMELDRLKQECTTLNARNEHTIHKVKNIISKLKDHAS